MLFRLRSRRRGCFNLDIALVVVDEEADGFLLTGGRFAFFRDGESQRVADVELWIRLPLLMRPANRSIVNLAVLILVRKERGALPYHLQHLLFLCVDLFLHLGGPMTEK